MQVRILLTEDDRNLGMILTEYLEANDFHVELAETGTEALELFNNTTDKYHICIFDIMMPKMDGFTLAEEIRKIDEDIPIVFLTAKSDKKDIIRGLELGADDYVTKPFSVEELMLRIKAILRRNQKYNQQKPEKIEIGECTFNNISRILSCNGKEKRLTSKEASLLYLLCLNKNKLVYRTTALKEVWIENNYFNSRSMDVYITKLRKYFQKNQQVEIINVHGKGFKLVVNDKK